MTKLAAKCTAKHLVPDYISAKIMRQEKDGNVFPCMGCRSFLMPYYDKAGKPKFYGRLTDKVGASLNNVNARKSGVAA